MDIVIGYQGKDHVKAEQLRRLIAGMAGDGTYVLGTQNELAATMVTANQVRIDTGDIVAAGGAYATVETPETLTVESGATGQKRHDLVVARYEKDASTSVESMELAVVKGTAVSFGDPVDPEVQDGSIIDGDSPVEVPLWRIPIDGLAPGTPVALFETIPTIDSLRDSVSRILDVPNVGITSESDTRDAWPVGVSWRWIGGWGKLADQPAIYGSVMTVRRSGGGDAQQLFLATTGDAWARSANASTGAWGTFKKLS